MISADSRGSREVLVVLDQLLGRMDDMRPALLEIGEDQTQSVKRRFTTATAPDGSAWAPNKQSTMDAYLGLFKGSHKKDGSLSKKGTARTAAKKPGTGETKALQTTINYQLQGADTVAIGSPMVYAAMFNFGGTRSQFPHLWGDIPAREAFGFSDDDRANILNVVESYLLGGT
ncbi:phage virion morphogenesis protein [Variovorax boronicumulans]|uniref:phage virion morphogenesis protein n=1 Tax=Variovorax boronicumulans TaxID=436515 RepID=UPI001C595282